MRNYLDCPHCGGEKIVNPLTLRVVQACCPEMHAEMEMDLMDAAEGRLDVAREGW